MFCTKTYNVFIARDRTGENLRLSGRGLCRDFAEIPPEFEITAARVRKGGFARRLIFRTGYGIMPIVNATKESLAMDSSLYIKPPFVDRHFDWKGINPSTRAEIDAFFVSEEEIPF